MQRFARHTRRRFLLTTAAGASTYLAARGGRAAAMPNTDPAAHLRLGWTGKFAWERLIDISALSGPDWDTRLAAAQTVLAAQGGGVIYFPAGSYTFRDSIRLASGVVLRGADPVGTRSALDPDYAPPTRLQFPAYKPAFEGDGTPITTAFKGIYLAQPSTASFVGVVHMALNRCHIHFEEGPDHACGAHRLVFGCTLRNAAVAEPAIPDTAAGQLAWQRFTRWHHPAINVKCERNALVANNRLPPSDDSFVMKGYVMRDRRGKERVTHDVVFDYDNRPGIAVSHYCVGAPGGEEPSGTPESHPHGFRTGMVIRDNFVYSTGRTAIGFSGDGTVCAHNVIRFPEGIWRQTNTGVRETSGSSTNDNRAVEMRGWRWVVEDNDFEVYRNWCADHKYYINDGEGLMHENHCNAHIKDSVLRHNKGNAYLSLYKTGAIDGLLVEGNTIAVDRGMAIFVDADHHPAHRGPCRNVVIRNNVTAGGGILLRGHPAEGNAIHGNRHEGPAAPILNAAGAAVRDNQGYTVENA